MMDDKMKAALRSMIVTEERKRCITARPEMTQGERDAIVKGAEWTLDYLRSQQEPVCYVPEPVIHGVKERGKYAAVLFDSPATNGLPFGEHPLYAAPQPADEELRRNSERYLHLRNHCTSRIARELVSARGGAVMDKRIDAAIAAEKREGS